MTEVSPRTVEEPMAFTDGEFRQGAFAAWISFMLLLVSMLIVTAVLNSGLPWGPPLAMITLYLMFGVPVGGAVSAVVTLIAAPILRLIARRLARSPRIIVHVAVYTAFGVLLGFVVLSAGVLITRGSFAYVFSTWFPAMVATMCALSVVSGWAWTARRHKRVPRHRAPAARHDAAV
ncbi:hypothetical protein ACSS7Z_09785 [Microbacterium sp. A82]|uniref:hypothetical protein n=1 Tax=unclassified Microbacterium TaxID=2609290 RepID=UPI003F2DE29C